MTRAARHRLLATLYGSQFIPLAFFLYALAAVLRERGAPLQRVGLIQLLALAWVVKFAWAPLVDRYGSRRLGHYRGWLLAVHLLMAGALLTLIPLDPVEDLPLLGTIVAAVALLSATQDIATDATAVRLLDPAERGVGNGIQKAGGYFGLMVGGGGALVVYDELGWGVALAMLAALTALPLLVLLRYHERERAAAARPAVSFQALGSFFRQPGAARWAFAVLPLYYLGIASAYPLVTPLLVDSGWPLERIGVVVIVGGGVVAIVAALASGAALGALGRRRALVMFGVVQVAAIAALLPLALHEGDTLTGLAAVALLNLAYAVTGTAVYTINMDWCRRASAGTDYTVQDSFVHLCSQLAGAAGLALAGALGYPSMLVISLVLGLTGVAAVAWLYREPAGMVDAEGVPTAVRVPAALGPDGEV